MRLVIFLRLIGSFMQQLYSISRSTLLLLGFSPGGAPSRAYRITRCARASTLGGIVRAICLAVLRLITSSNLVGCSTGKSAGLAPLRILSTYAALRRNRSER